MRGVGAPPDGDKLTPGWLVTAGFPNRSVGLPSSFGVPAPHELKSEIETHSDRQTGSGRFVFNVAPDGGTRLMIADLQSRGNPVIRSDLVVFPMIARFASLSGRLVSADMPGQYYYREVRCSFDAEMLLPAIGSDAVVMPLGVLASALSFQHALYFTS